MAEPPLSQIGPVVVMGVSGSGKSFIGTRLADALALPFIEGDQLHPEANVAKMSAGIPLTDEDRWPWLDRVGEALKAATRNGGGAVAACSALKRTYRDRLREFAGPRLRFVFLSGSRDLLLQRMTARKHHFMPATLLDSQLQTLEPPTNEDGVVTIDVDATPEAIVAAAVRWLSARAEPNRRAT
jgi:gluconokinase